MLFEIPCAIIYTAVKSKNVFAPLWKIPYEQMKKVRSDTMSQQLIKDITAEYRREDIPVFNSGDNVKVSVRIKEGNRERIQVFEGLVIKKQNGGVSETFTVRKVSYGIGIERTFPVHSPSIESIQVVRRGKVRRAKLHYIRGLSAKQSRIKERR